MPETHPPSVENRPRAYLQRPAWRTLEVSLPNTEFTVILLGFLPKSATIRWSLQEIILASSVVVVLRARQPVIVVVVTEVPDPAA